MDEPRVGCSRCRHLLDRLDDASARGVDDPTTALPGDDVAWLARHLESCAACAPEQAAIAALGTMLQDEIAAQPDEAFFAARRAVLVDTIRASDAANDGGVVGAGAPARVATRPTLRAIPGTGAARGTRQAPPRSIWRPVRPVLSAIAAGVVIAIALGVLRARTQRPSAADVAAVEVASVELMAAIDADSADDSWVVASTDPFELALSSTSDPSLDETRDDGLEEINAEIDDEIEEIEGVFLPSPGWS